MEMQFLHFPTFLKINSIFFWASLLQQFRFSSIAFLMLNPFLLSISRVVVFLDLILTTALSPWYCNFGIHVCFLLWMLLSLVSQRHGCVLFIFVSQCLQYMLQYMALNKCWKNTQRINLSKERVRCFGVSQEMHMLSGKTKSSKC